MSPSVSSELGQAQLNRLGGDGRQDRVRGRPKSSGPKRGEARVGKDRELAGDRNRLISAYEAALAVAQEVTLDAVLQRIVDSAREVVPAQYAALGVNDEHGQITRFFTSGITAEEWSLIAPLPRGSGLIGEMVRECVWPVVPHVADDPSSIGFPPEHPPMQTLLGVPILLGGQVLGNLYLTEQGEERPFDEEDLAALQILTTRAAVAIDRAQAYHRMEEQRDQLRIILDNLPSAVMILAAPDGKTELANAVACAMSFGSAPPPGVLPVYGRDFQLHQADGTPLSREHRLEARARLLQGDVIRNHQYLLESADGRRVPVLAQVAPLPNAAGLIDRVVLVIQDITRLREAEQLKDDFLSLVSHEFRTPLTTIHGGAHLLANQGETLTEETRRELLDDIVAETDHLDQMLANMLTLTAVMAGCLPVRAEPLLLEALARATAGEVAAHAPHHDFQVKIPRDLPPSEGDPALVAQVLRNLYENAVKYSPAGGLVHTTALTNGRVVTIQVTDNGIGIAADEVDRVFQRFHRAGTDPSVRGMGLGLYLSHHLIEAQGGHIAASSPGLKQGATFSVSLPLARECRDERETATPDTPGGE
jgi:signal transduction histidine kinase